MIAISPNEPLTAYLLLTGAVTAAVVGIPLLIGLLNYRRASKDGEAKDIAALVSPIISSLIKTHNEEEYAHPKALARYTTTDAFNAALREIRTEIRAFKDAMDLNELRRREDVATFRDEFKELKANVARVLGRRADDVQG